MVLVVVVVFIVVVFVVIVFVAIVFVVIVFVVVVFVAMALCQRTPKNAISHTKTMFFFSLPPPSTSV